MSEKMKVEKMIKENLKRIGFDKLMKENEMEYSLNEIQDEKIQRQVLYSNCSLLKIQCEIIMDCIKNNVDNERLTKECIELLMIIDNVI